MNLIKLMAGVSITWILASIAIVIGWVANIVQLVAMLKAPISGLFVLKAVGILAFPVGGVLGLLGFFA